VFVTAFYSASHVTRNLPTSIQRLCSALRPTHFPPVHSLLLRHAVVARSTLSGTLFISVIFYTDYDLQSLRMEWDIKHWRSTYCLIIGTGYNGFKCIFKERSLPAAFQCKRTDYRSRSQCGLIIRPNRNGTGEYKPKLMGEYWRKRERESLPLTMKYTNISLTAAS
jgi:hypothetical protein